MLLYQKIREHILGVVLFLKIPKGTKILLDSFSILSLIENKYISVKCVGYPYMDFDFGWIFALNI